VTKAAEWDALGDTRASIDASFRPAG